ncbi:DCL family protein [Agrobacterium tumefaciens]|uniref:DCL family protein n=1 Tax=Agrobacterium tumefaciens TaxID=358 RepID=UPI0015738F23|nr:DCL family protein [Agrobacterium tumefaciens]NSY99585.1 DCL family protein [Agrobacterium tumefaciens]NSZ36338.1 DCL family protein [Agrobacterium tumefaciens]NTB21854.1 DCL family protein [Agrobacterium tumefaciens]NTB31800.1 DCL family protein [Agrobacterium tumefaciens]NTB32167.1 DCL family protein [Agrobacterium tumefaciens]
MAKPVELSNGRIWKTKAAAKQHFRDMLARYEDGDVITDYDDHSDLSALLERFDVLVAEGAPKIGPGIDRFERRLNKGDGWSSPGFWIVRTDKTATDFSFPKAVDGNPKSSSQEFYDACHNAVSLDLLHMKQKQFDHFANAEGEIECDVTGKLVVYADANLNHANPPFAAIVNDFRKLKGWELAFPPGTLTVSKDAQLSTHFADDALAREFRDHHHNVAVLRIVAKSRPPGSTTMSLTVKRPLRFK